MDQPGFNGYGQGIQNRTRFMSSISLRRHRYRRSCGHKELSYEKGQESAILVLGVGVPGGDSILEEP